MHSLEPGETPSYSASRKAQNYVQRYKLSQKTLSCGSVTIIFSIYLCSALNCFRGNPMSIFGEKRYTPCGILLNNYKYYLKKIKFIKSYFLLFLHFSYFDDTLILFNMFRHIQIIFKSKTHILLGF